MNQPGSASSGERIPRAFMVLCDAVAVSIALFMSCFLAPDLQSTLLSLEAIEFLRPWIVLPSEPGFGEISAASLLVLTISSLATLIFMEMLGGYGQLINQSRTRLILSSVGSPLLAVCLATMIFFTIKAPDSSRVLVYAFAALSVINILAYRSTLRAYKRQRLAAGFYARNVLLLGDSRSIRWLSQHFKAHVAPNRCDIIGWLTTSDLVDASEAEGRSLQCFGRVEDLGSVLVIRPVNEVVAMLSEAEREWLPKAVDVCDYFRARLHVVPQALAFGDLRDLTPLATEPFRLPGIVLAPKDFESDALFLKRLLDIALSSVLLVLLAPLFAVTAIAIKLTTPDLPVLYPWHVIGFRGRPFTGYKFTTMVADADAQKETLQAKNEMTGPVFKIRDDPRMTPLGRWLRKYSINELPQLVSVLRGDMSLVGPRPAGPHELVRYEMWHKRKLCVQPGITCLWQVSGRNKISNFDEWIRLDLEYIRNWSIWLDFKILLRTVVVVLKGTGS